MRSKVVTALFEGLGYKALQLEGGHKAYRNFVLKELNEFDFKPKLIVVYGLTGTGKTDLLKKFSNSLDLEEIAQHRNSRLGMVGLNPRNQKMFDAMILQRLKALQNQDFVVIEGESRKLGKVLLPEFLFKAMKKGINVKAVLDMDLRAQRIVKDYFDTEEKKNEVKEIVKTMVQAMSRKVVDDIVAAIENEDYLTATKLLFIHFYDPKYNHTVENVNYDLILDMTDLDDVGKFINENYFSSNN